MAGTVLVLLATAASCSRSISPEQRIRQSLNRAVDAAENRDLGALREFVSDRYADSAGRDRRAINQLVTLHVGRNRSIHLFTRIESITLTAPEQAGVVLLMAMTGRPVSEANELEGLQADLLRVELELAREGKGWKVTGAAWRGASLSEFLLGSGRS